MAEELLVKTPDSREFRKETLEDELRRGVRFLLAKNKRSNVAVASDFPSRQDMKSLSANELESLLLALGATADDVADIRNGDYRSCV